MRVIADTDVCVAAGQCVLTADDLFDQDDDGIVVLTRTEVPAGREDAARRAVSLCPARALRIASAPA
jgi:ferredoxin